MSNLFEHIVNRIKETGLIASGESIVVGVSGGADSVLLLHALASLRESMKIDILAVHVHHGIRGAEADRDAEFVREQCDGLEVPCRVIRADVPSIALQEKMTVEEAGRTVRYGFFFEEMERVGAHKLAVAHHRDDSAETILFNLVRGSGIKGLCGIAPIQGKIIRPLIDLRRTEIEETLSEAGLCWREDSTNQEVVYSRNRIRHELIPYLEREFNSDAVDHLTKMAGILRDIDDHMEAEAERWIETYAKPGSLPVEPLKAADRALQGYLIRKRLGELGGLKDITSEHVEMIRSLLGKTGGKTICLPGGRSVRREYDQLFFFTVNEDKETGMIPVELSVCEISPEKVEKIASDPYTKCFDYDKIKVKLCLRTRKTGDSLVVFADGRSQSVKEYMINAKIPAGQRDRIPLLVSGDEVVWIVGYRASEKFRVTDETRRVLLVKATTNNI